MPTQKIHINKIVSNQQSPFQLFLAVLGCLIGFIMILLAVQSAINFNTVVSNNSGIGSQYMVINKKINMLNSFGMKRSYFSEEEITKIASHPAIEKFSNFIGNDFEAEATLEFESGSTKARLRTDLFLESVDDDFLDIPLDEWDWDPQKKEIPIILPTDFINLYNFTYAPARNLPQISKSTTKLFKFSISITGNGKAANYKGSIIGFSDRISSMIVPKRFMAFANEQYGTIDSDQKKGAYRIITAVSPSKLPEFESFLKGNNYETNQELLKNGKIAGLMYLVVFIVFIIGLLVAFNAFTGFVLYFQLLIYRSRVDIDSLLRLGYSHQRVVNSFFFKILSIIFMVLLLGAGAVLVCQLYLSAFLSKNNFYISGNLHPLSILTVIGISAILCGLFYLQIRREIFGIALPNLSAKQKQVKKQLN